MFGDVLVLVLRGPIEAAVEAALDRFGGDLPVREVIIKDREVILKIDAPLGHEVHRWLNEPNSALIWFNHA